jgi:hypothetical protein
MLINTTDMRADDFASTFPAGVGPTMNDAEWMVHMQRRLRSLQVIVMLAIVGAAAAAVVLL